MMRRLFIYLLLLSGSLIFLWPFLWMAATTAKLDRELFDDRGLIPQRPVPRMESPYVEERAFKEGDTERAETAIRIIENALRDSTYSWPAELDRELVISETAQGVSRRLRFIMPSETWQLPEAEFARAIAGSVSPEIITDVVQQLRRVLCLGQLRARSYDLQEDQLVTPSQVATAWKVTGPVTLSQAGTVQEPYAEAHYDFSKGNRVILEQTFTTSFPIERLHRLQLSVRADNTWHALTMFVERNGVRYRAKKPVYLSDHTWFVSTWQWPGPDDRLTKIRSWTLLEEIDRGPRYSNAPNQLKITLELERSGQLEAWWAKLSRNYKLTLEHIPFWRYVGTSLFLVILNLVGTLFSCSLVAYAFARLQWPGRSLAFALLLATMMIPPQVTMIPQFLIMQKLGWYNTLTPLWIMSFIAPAFYVFLLRQFLKGIPRDLEDAARLDGCGFFRIYWHIMLPLVKPTLAAIAIFTFMATWNEFMMPLIYLSDQRLYPLSFGLYAFNVQVTNPGTAQGMGMVMAGSLLMTLPVIAIFFFAQRYFLQGVTLTGMKG